MKYALHTFAILWILSLTGITLSIQENGKSGQLMFCGTSKPLIDGGFFDGSMPPRLQPHPGGKRWLTLKDINNPPGPGLYTYSVKKHGYPGWYYSLVRDNGIEHETGVDFEMDKLVPALGVALFPAFLLFIPFWLWKRKARATSALAPAP